MKTDFKLFIAYSLAFAFLVSPFFLFEIKENRVWLFVLANIIIFSIASNYLQTIIHNHLRGVTGAIEMSLYAGVSSVIVAGLLSWWVAEANMKHKCDWPDCPHIGKKEFLSGWAGGYTRGTKGYKAERIHFYNPELKYEEIEKLVK